MPAKYIIGIDLGTTNSALAYAALDADKPEVTLLPLITGLNNWPPLS